MILVVCMESSFLRPLGSGENVTSVEVLKELVMSRYRCLGQQLGGGDLYPAITAVREVTVLVSGVRLWLKTKTSTHLHYLLLTHT